MMSFLHRENDVRGMLPLKSRDDVSEIFLGSSSREKQACQ